MASNQKELVEFLTQSIIFGERTLESEGLSSDVWQPYLASGRHSFLKKGEYLMRIGDNILGTYFVKKGMIRSNLLGCDGMVKTVSITCDGALFGEQFIFHTQPALYEALAMEDCELYFYSREQMLQMMRQDFAVSLFVAKTLSLRSRMMATQLQDLCLRSVQQSLARILYSISCYEEQNGKRLGSVVISLSHEELANILGAHRVTVSKNLGQLKKMGVIDYQYERIIIRDREKLKDMAAV